MAGLLHKLTSLGKRSDAPSPNLHDWINYAALPAAVINSSGQILAANIMEQ